MDDTYIIYISYPSYGRTFIFHLFRISIIQAYWNIHIISIIIIHLNKHQFLGLIGKLLVHYVSLDWTNSNMFFAMQFLGKEKEQNETEKKASNSFKDHCALSWFTIYFLWNYSKNEKLRRN